ncbi:MAG: diguanylate cyclase domain [Frankiales bacterium]|nr:diguanylate cyclase domain [Frankiales bacterium]
MSIPGERPDRRGLVAHLDEIISVIAPDGTVLSVNRDSAGGPSEADGRDSRSWVHPDDQQVVTQAFLDLLADPSRTTLTVVRVQQEGQPYRWMETTGVNRVADPEVGGLVFVSRDVHERVLLTRAAERSLAAQRLVADLGVRMLLDHSLENGLGEVLSRTAALLEAPHVGLLERDADRRLRVTRWCGADPLPDGHVLSRGTGPSVPELRARGVVATADAPLQAPEGALGQLVACWTDEHEFDDVQRQLLQGVANVLSGARQRERRENEAVVRAMHDPLTGLPTRPLLQDRLDHALLRARRGGGHVGVLLVDLDRFKEVNDRFGHAAGDVVLTELGARLAGHVRPGDTAARLGGDEFVVLCEDVEGDDAVLELAERLRRVFAEPFAVDGVGRLVLSGSVGWACSATTGHDGAALLHTADRAMYRDKRQRSG